MYPLYSSIQATRVGKILSECFKQKYWYVYNQKKQFCLPCSSCHGRLLDFISIIIPLFNKVFNLSSEIAIRRYGTFMLMPSLILAKFDQCQVGLVTHKGGSNTLWCLLSNSYIISKQVFQNCFEQWHFYNSDIVAVLQHFCNSCIHLIWTMVRFLWMSFHKGINTKRISSIWKHDF